MRNTTSGPGSDIRAGDPACVKFAANEKFDLALRLAQRVVDRNVNVNIGKVERISEKRIEPFDCFAAMLVRGNGLEPIVVFIHTNRAYLEAMLDHVDQPEQFRIEPARAVHVPDDVSAAIDDWRTIFVPQRSDGSLLVEWARRSRVMAAAGLDKLDIEVLRTIRFDILEAVKP